MFASQLWPILLAGLLTTRLADAAEKSNGATALSAWIPEQAALCLEIYQPGAILEPLLSSAFGERLASVPAYDRHRNSKQMQDLLGLTRLIEVTAQTNWQSAIRTITREGAAFALGAGNRRLLVLGGDDPSLLEKLHTFARQLAVSEADKQGQTDRVRSTDYAGVTGWTFNGQEAHALVGPRLLAASDAEVLRRALDLRSSGTGSLADRPVYQAARKAVGKDAAAMVFLDLEQLRQAPQFLNALDEQSHNPLAALLLAGYTGPIRSAPWLALGVYVEGGTLAIRSFVGGDHALEATPLFARPPAGTNGQQPTLEIPRQIAALSLYRDLAGFYAAKDTLFPQRTSGLIFFENMMGIFFTGRNLTDEVLAQTTPRVRLVAARQEFDPAIGTPDPQLPSFAVVFELRNPQDFGEVVEEAWQKALGLVNFTRGQKALPGLILDRTNYHGTTVTVARYSAKEVPDRNHLDSRFNFRPTLALVHGHAILSSTDQLACDLVDALAQKPASEAAAGPGAHSFLQLSGRELGTILKANRFALVEGNMLKDGKTQAEAEVTIDTLCSLAGWVDRASLQLGQGPAGQTGELRLTFSKP